MAKLNLKNIGPISTVDNSQNEYINFDGITVFIGNQGTGKSTIAKLFSTLSWIEKALVRGDFSPKYIMQYNRFRNKYLAYQNIHNYIKEDSYFEYEGDAYNFIFNNGEFIVSSQKNKDYSFPKIMYVPSERNFVSSVDKPDIIKRLPLPLYTFMDEYEDALQNINGQLKLPIGNANFEYNKHKRKAFISSADYSIELTEASSGYQSFVPLLLVTKYLSDIINDKITDNRKDLNRQEEIKIRKAVDELLKDNKITDEVLKATLERISTRYKYDSFINIVEEPEQNLFPISQKEILFELLKNYNENINNNFVITTHSPYIINYISIAIQAHYLSQQIQKKSNSNKSVSLLNKLKEKIPLESVIDPTKINIYQINENGFVEKLDMPYGIPSDKNYLNQQLRFGNIVFDSLLEIEEEL